MHEDRSVKVMLLYIQFDVGLTILTTSPGRKVEPGCEPVQEEMLKQ